MDARTPLAILKKVRSLLRYPKRWQQTSFADNLAAPSCMCLDGAIHYAITGSNPCNLGPNDSPLYGGVLKALGFKVDTEVHAWNDMRRRTHAQVLARIDRGIAKLTK